MVSSYKGTENSEQLKWLLLTVDTNQGVMRINIIGVFRTETTRIDQALRNGTLYRATSKMGNSIAIAPKRIVSIEVIEDAYQD